MVDLDEVMGFSQKQKDALAGSTGRVNIWDGSVRSGKTYTWTILMLGLIAAYQGTAAIVISGKNRDSIYRNVFEPIETLAIFAPIKHHVLYRQGAAKATIFGRHVHIIGANDAGSESKIRGMTIGLAFADEITLLHPSFFKQLLSRLSKSYSKLFCTTNPDSQNHWLRKDYLVRVPGCMHYDAKTAPGDQLSDWTYWHFTMDDNPSLTSGYKSNLKKEYTGMWYRRFIQGLWVAAEGAIYAMWDEEKHVINPEDMPPMQDVLALGIDYGTTHPTVGILLGIGTDRKLYAMDEWLPGRLTDAALSASLQEFRESHPEPRWVFVDPAAASFSLQLHEDGHRHVDKADNNVLDGIRTVASLLDNGQLFISSTCKKLIDEFPGYRWDEKTAERGIDKPIKEIDDACLVEGTLIATPDGPKEIQHIVAGNVVSLPDGDYTVIAAQMTNPSAQVRTIHLSNATSITGTLNHPILVNGQWVPLGELTVGQELTSWQSPNSLSIKASDSDATQKPENNRTGATTRPESVTKCAASTTSTGKFGETTTIGKKSQTDTTCTTSTMTTVTIGQRIYNWLRGLVTSLTTWKNVTKTPSGWLNLVPVWTELGHSQKNGTAARRGTNGTKTIGIKAWRCSLLTGLKPVSNAGWSTPPIHLTALTGSAQTNANPHGVVHPDLMTNNDSANTVEKSSPQTSTPKLVPVPVSVVGLSDASAGQRVYNLTIAGKHQYLANGLITHNCDSLRYSVFSSRYLWSRMIEH